MIYNEKEQENKAVSKAWNILYQRLEKDGLLPDAHEQKAFGRKIELKQTNVQTPPAYMPQRRLFSLSGKAAIAAAIVVCIFFGWYYLQKTNPDSMTMQVLYNEANAPILATMLEDGSVVYLSEQTSLKYPDHFDDNNREVTLQGEAFFDVKKQSERPFIIQTDIASVEVTGTSFKIKSDRNASFLLSVREGEVRVTQKSRFQVLTVQTGETVFFDSEQFQLKKNDVVFDDFFKRIHFKDEYLVDVATIINLHSDSLRLQVDPSIDNRITITFPENGNIVETAEAICQALDLHYLLQDNTIYISQPK